MPAAPPSPPSTPTVVGVVLAAGAGTRLQPLTRLRPKAMCPVANRPLVDWALDRAASAPLARVAVNVHHGRQSLEGHLHRIRIHDGGAGAPAVRVPLHISVEEREALGTAGALGYLRPWIDGAGTLVLNADTWCPGSLEAFVAGWDGERVRLLVCGSERLEPTSQVAAALMPWSEVAALEPVPAGLYEASWRAAQARGRVEVVRHDGPFVDCGTPAQYLEANLQASDGASVVEPGARVEGTLDECVVWAEAHVDPGEHLRRAIRLAGSLTVLVR
ncbi:MAG: NDP-sugar synthase [Acidimicrobiia bacterium]|jgi:N-acetyl-alpha-D-muramate 1-phosphate uridylyltransferase